MADEQHQWLDRDAAERLLRGEPLEGIDPDTRPEADRLAQALAALAAQTAQAAQVAQADSGVENAAGSAPRAVAGSGELPGEAAALAAFRAARAENAGAARSGGARTAPYATAAHEAAAGETVRMGRAGDRPRPSRWGRPVRFGLAAALAACMIGGVAVAAGTGVLPSPFGAHSDPGPAVSASPVATPEEPSATPSEEAGEPSEDMVPDASTAPDEEPTSRETASSPPPEAEAGGEHTGSPQQPSGDRTPRGDEAKQWYRKVVLACRAYRSGELQGDKRRRLEEAAKGPARVEAFCGRVLGGPGGGGQHGGGQHGGDGQQGGGDGSHGGDGGGQGGGDGDGDGENGSGGDGDGGDGGDGGSGGDTGGHPVPPVSTPSAHPPTPASSRSALPTFP
ncbi:hypothetical protein AB0N81_29595 [Streptomyces sp. NPDC093510]|uniref:hypothetical protein n=1 Tax=Streptomyces sp. NPDC093510 TaxID=3155199 RepID=UPI003429738C